MNVFVSSHERREHSEQAEEQFGSWSKSFSFTVDGVYAAPPHFKSAEQFELDIDLSPGDQVITLSIRWSDGDSFGHADGKGEVMWVFKDPALAGKAKHAWEVACGWHDDKDWRRDNKTQSVEFTADGGRTIKMGNPCWGYFERLDAVELEQFTVN
jgi:hypothetical protein